MPPSSTVNSRRGPLWLRSLLWLMALLLALGSMVYQKTTGPTYPQRGSFEMNGRTHDYSLLRSDESSRSSRDARVELPDPGQPAGGRIHWRRFPTEDPFVSAPLSREAGEDGEALLVGLLPAQPAAGKLEYFLSLESPGQAPLRIPDKTVIIRFKDCVPTAILLPHVLLMALSILVGLRAGMGALFTPGSMRLWAWITLGTITVGGMILAIMTGTVYERMREINIFSSVGLAPRHVAGMFLIESLVYAGIASVVGYFIGIVALRYMSQANVLPKDFYPNYLGVYVLYAIGIAMLATVASSLYPIRVASRMVNPSLERTWKIDTEPEGDFWYISLPFIATSLPEAAGMIAYAYEFLSVHQGERTGKFVCQSPPQPKAVDGLPAVEAEIWLAPFERNMTQHVVLRIEAGDRPGRWGFALRLRRLSGPAYLWQRSNRAFVDALRKHLLNWRAMAEPETNLFVEEARDLFGRAVLT